MTTLRKRITLVAALVVTAAVITLVVRPRAIEVEVAAVQRGPLRSTVDAEGRTRVRERYVIAAPVTGRLERLEVRAGDVVSAGTVLARLAPTPLDATTEAQARSRLAAAEALEREAATRLSQSRTAAAHARRTAERFRALEAAGGISRQELDQAELALRTSDDDASAADLRLRAATADVRAARATLLGADSRSRAVVAVRSPVRGRVLRVPDVSERVIAAGTPLLEVGDPSTVEVVVDVLSTDAVKIVAGAEASIEDWGGERTLRACVRRVEPSAATRVSALGVEEQRVDVVLDLLEGASELGDGYRVEVKILVWGGEAVLTVPSSAVFRVAGEWHVFVVQEGRVHDRAIAIGHRGDAALEVVKGLTVGERVVLFPSDALRDGARVKARHTEEEIR